MSLLPSLFTMQTISGGSYLAVAEMSSSGNMRFVEKSIWSQRAHFAVEPSKSGNSNLVHIRSRHNNKYWVAQEINKQVYVSAAADEPVEDTKDPACTLFQLGGSSRHVRFKCISTNMFLMHNIGLTMYHIGQEFPTTDLESLVYLPSQVSFISESLKDHWAYSKVLDKRNYHRLDAGREIGNIRVAHELLPTDRGNYRIKNLHFGKFWRNGNTWVWAEAESNDNSSNATFSFVKLSDGVLALRSLGNNRFCGPDVKGKVNYLRAEFPTLTRQTRLLVQERVLERTISDIKYRFDEARIHQQEFVEVSHYVAKNNTNTEDKMEIKFSIKETKTTSWRNSFSLKFGVKVQLKVTIVPVIVKGKLEASAEIDYTQEWGEVNTTTIERSLSYHVAVPAFTTKRVTLVCWRAACDVPYSYMQRDLLPDGKTVNIPKDDGIFFGVNSFNFEVESSDVSEDALGRIYL